FADPGWDGPPLPPDGPPPEPPKPPKPPVEPPDGPDGPVPPEPPKEKLVVELADGTKRRIQYVSATTYWSADGRPISAAEFLKRLFGDLSNMVANEDELRNIWSDPDNREHFLTKLAEHGYDQDRLDDIRQLVDATDSDLFDVLGFILFEYSPKTREDRAAGVRQDGLPNAEGELKELLLGILKAYEKDGESELGTKKLGDFLKARYGSVSESKGKLGELSSVRDAFRNMQRGLYAD
ncbi:restriction endonuclease subunit R, partial [Yoonia sp.]|nr:restriction endonuclease subunit R [Yoonia sp.]